MGAANLEMYNSVSESIDTRAFLGTKKDTID